MMDEIIPVPNNGSDTGLGAGSNTGEYIRMEDAQKLIKEAVDIAVRQAQSLTDKSAHRLNTQISEVKNTLSSLQSSGLPVPADTLAAMREITNSLDVGGEAVQDEQKQEPDDIGPTEEEEAAVNRAAREIFQKLGVVVNLDDPEAKMIDYSTPEAFLESLPTAAAAKASRINSDMPRPPMMGRGGVSNPIESLRKPGDLYAIALGEKRR